ncbi:MAG TPA: ethanolamine utilization protein EutJ [Bdellovibrionales bacterium]|nr:ethanolamine utilization protein EutJ [Pseudobdellovibrionaceae bacterium]HAG90240.1 ethanolamine utilization protein EutJ [Bdellovibrionales bacterium]|tara:strand:- start:1914 stop:3065 length:1152 start_codon:yes stop_codon:yes gene_type:complete
MKKFIFGSLILSFFNFGMIGCTGNSDKASNDSEIRIGQFGSLTGAEATFGQSTDKGIRLAIDAVNAAGGVKGKKIKLITEDNQGKPDEAAAVVKKLITQDNVLALLGEVASNRSLAAAPIAQQFRIPMISPSSTNPKVTEIGNYIFRVCFIDPFQGPVMAKFAFEDLKVKKVAILKDLKSDYSLGLTEFFEKKFKELGGEITSIQNFQTGDTDFKAQLTAIRSEKPDAIFIPAYYTEVGLIARQARQLGIKATLLGGDGWDSPKLFEIGGEAIEGAYYSNHYSTESPNPATQEFIKKYKEKYSETPDGMAASGYDAARVLVQALEKVDELTPDKVREAIAETKDFKGATGTITIDQNRNADKEAFIVQVKDKGLKFIRTLSLK